MNHSLYIFFVFLLVACVNQSEINVEPISLEKSDKALLVNAHIYTTDDILSILHQKASKKFVCHNTNNDRIEDYISSFNNNQLVAKLSICKNNNNDSCLEKEIVPPVSLQCQLVFSDMIGGVIKSKKFNIVYN